MPMRRPLAILVAVLLAALLPVACGGDDEPEPDAGELLAEAFSNHPESGKASATVKLQAEGAEALDDGVELRLSGPFSREGVAFDVSAVGLVPGLAGRITATRDNLWLSFAGRSYEAGEGLVGSLLSEVLGHARKQHGDGARAGVARWLTDARVDGEEELDGEDATKVVAKLDGAAVAADVAGLAGDAGRELSDEDREIVGRLLGDVTVAVWVAGSDTTVRRLAARASFEVPETLRDRVLGAERGRLELDLTLTDVGEPQEIEVPEDARPLDELLRQFGLSLEMLRP